MTQPLFDFTTYSKFFIGLLALIDPVGIIPMFISMTGYQLAAVCNEINLTTNLSVMTILLTPSFLGDGTLQIFDISIGSLHITGGILMVTIMMSMISGKLSEGKQNKQEKPEMTARESIDVVSLTLPLMAGPEAIGPTIVWDTRYYSWVHPVGSSLAIAVSAPYCWDILRTAPWLIRLLGQTGINIITRTVGLLLMALGIELIVTGIKALFPGLFNWWNIMQAWRLHFAFARLLTKPINQREISCWDNVLR